MSVEETGDTAKARAAALLVPQKVLMKGFTKTESVKSSELFAYTNGTDKAEQRQFKGTTDTDIDALQHFMSIMLFKQVQEQP